MEKGCTRITVVVEVGDPCGNWETRRIGHTGIAIDQDYYDLGPGTLVNLENVIGTRFFGWHENTRPWWQDYWYSTTLDEIVNEINTYAAYPTVTIEFCVCLSKTQQIRDYWEKAKINMRSSNPDFYWFLGYNCSTSVWNSLGISYGCNRAPERLLDEDMIKQIKNTCAYGDSRPYIKLIKETRN